MATEDVSILTQFSENGSITSQPLYPVVTPGANPSEQTTPDDLTAPDGSPVSDEVIHLELSSRNSDGTYANVTETIQPLKVVAGTQPQLPTPSPSINSEGDAVLPTYDFYQYQTINSEPGGNDDYNDLVSRATSSGDDTVASAIQFIHRNLQEVDQSAASLSTSPSIEAGLDLPSGATRHLLIDAAIAAGAGLVAASGGGVALLIGGAVGALAAADAIHTATGVNITSYLQNHLGLLEHDIKNSH